MDRRFRPHTGVGAVLAGAVMGLAACGGASTGATPSGEAGRGSASPASTVSPIPQQPGPAGGSCGAARRIVVDPSAPAQRVCLRVGEVLQLSTPASLHQPWQPFASSDAQVLECRPGNAAEGAAAATCTARRSGGATVSTATAAFTGDPHGPAQFAWWLAVDVTD